jgi:hypothetical protein
LQLDDNTGNFSANGDTPQFYKIVRKRMKAKELIFALGSKSEARVRKRLKIKKKADYRVIR